MGGLARSVANGLQIQRNGYKIVGLMEGEIITEDCRVFRPAGKRVNSVRVPKWIVGCPMPKGFAIFRRVQE